MAYNSAYTGQQIDEAIGSVKQKESTWDGKQDKLTGTQGQVVGFDGEGNAVAQESTKPKSVSVTLSASGWASNAQTVTVNGVLADETKQLIQPMPAIASQDAYISAGIICSGQAADSLTFTCTTVPTENITIYVVIQDVDYTPPPYKPVFADNTWEQIIAACQANEVPDTWVADGSCYKDMEINGKAYRIDIIGKNHDTYAAGGTAPLTFQMHDCYDETKQMNSSNTNRDGWQNSAMRTTHLPAILNLMPAEVKAAIRDVQKKSSAGNQSSSIQTTNDKLFLLSEIEIFGSTTYSFAGEGKQYAYYQAGNSKVKNLSGSASFWWERSPRSSNSASFCSVSSNSVANATSASVSYGVAFGFCF